jgi:hypothetical protein
MAVILPMPVSSPGMGYECHGILLGVDELELYGVDWLASRGRC